jgi:hypothetical protein
MNMRQKFEKDDELRALWGKDDRPEVTTALDEIAHEAAPTGLRRRLMAIPTERPSLLEMLRLPILVPALAALLIALYLPLGWLQTPQSQPSQSSVISLDDDDMLVDDTDLVADLFDPELQLMENYI